MSEPERRPERDKAQMQRLVADMFRVPPALNGLGDYEGLIQTNTYATHKMLDGLWLEDGDTELKMQLAVTSVLAQLDAYIKRHHLRPVSDAITMTSDKSAAYFMRRQVVLIAECRANGTPPEPPPSSRRERWRRRIRTILRAP